MNKTRLSTNMEIKFYLPRWGSESIPWPEFTNGAAADGYRGIELFPLQTRHEKPDVLKAIEDEGLELALIHFEAEESGSNFNRYKQALERNLYLLADYQTSRIKPQFINSHTGRDFFTHDQMAECFAICERIGDEIGIPVIHETHRGKWSFAAHITKTYLQKFDNLRLALDLSHWVCVSESYLEEQDEAVELALQRADHLHARVGHIQGPQVTDPRAPENAEALAHHLAWWDRWIALQRSRGLSTCTITPEFGPYPYMSYQCFTQTPVANQRQINNHIKALLSDRYSAL